MSTTPTTQRPAEGVVALSHLRGRLASLVNGVRSIQSKIEHKRAELKQLEGNLIATRGGADTLNQLIMDEEKKLAEAIKDAATAPTVDEVDEGEKAEKLDQGTTQ